MSKRDRRWRILVSSYKDFFEALATIFVPSTATARINTNPASMHSLMLLANSSLSSLNFSFLNPAIVWKSGLSPPLSHWIGGHILEPWHRITS